MNWFSELYPNPYPAPGTVIWIRAYLFYRHKGIVSDRWYDGKPMVICNSPDYGVIEQTWDQFGAGQMPEPEGYPGKLPYWEVLSRARSQLGMPYHLFGSNCDHLKNFAHGIPVESEQLKATMVAFTFVGVVAVAVAK